MNKKDKLQITWDDLKEEEYTFDKVDSYIISDYLTDCYVRGELPLHLHKLYLKFYMYKLDLSQDTVIKIPYSQVQILAEFLQGRVLHSKRLEECTFNMIDWLINNL